MASIIAKIIGDGTSFDKTVSGVQGKVNTLKKAFGALSAFIGLGTLTSWAKELIKTADRLDDVSQKLGVSTDFLQEWNFMAERSGLAASTGEMALQRFVRRVGDAQKGVGEFLPVAKKYNIALFDSAGKARTAADVMDDFADVIAGLDNAAEKVSTTFKAVDSEGVPMVNTFNKGAAGMRAMREEAHELNRVISESTIKRLSLLQDKINDIVAGFKTLGTEVIGGIALELHTAKLALDAFLNRQEKLGEGFTRSSTTFTAALDAAENIYDAALKTNEALNRQLILKKILTDADVTRLLREQEIEATNLSINEILTENADTLRTKVLSTQENILRVQEKIAEQAAIVANEQTPSEGRLAAAKELTNLQRDLLALVLEEQKAAAAAAEEKLKAAEKMKAAKMEELELYFEILDAEMDGAREESKRAAELKAAKLEELGLYFDILDAQMDAAREEVKRTEELQKQGSELWKQFQTIKMQSAEWEKTGRFAVNFSEIASGTFGTTTQQVQAQRIQELDALVRRQILEGFTQENIDRTRASLNLAEEKFQNSTGIDPSENPFKSALKDAEDELKDINKKFSAL